MLYFLFSVVKATVLLADISDFGEVNNVYKQCKLSMRFEVTIAISTRLLLTSEPAALLAVGSSLEN
jgi:hypothetical protein